MKKKHSLILDDEFIQYCKLNNIDDVEKFAKDLFNKAFTGIKYSEKPNISLPKSEVKSSINEITNVILNVDSSPKPKLEVPPKEKDIYEE